MPGIRAGLDIDDPGKVKGHAIMITAFFSIFPNNYK